MEYPLFGQAEMKRNFPVTRRGAMSKSHARLAEFNSRRFTLRGIFDAGPEDLFFLNSQEEAENICRWLTANAELRDFEVLDNDPNGENDLWHKRQTELLKPSDLRNDQPRRPRSLNSRKDWEKTAKYNPEQPPTLWD
jgi:hypothetical protein